MKSVYELKNEACIWINEHKTALKAGAWCLGIGFVIGVSKGVGLESDHVTRLIDKIPHYPDLNDIDDYLIDSADPEFVKHLISSLKESGWLELLDYTLEEKK